MLKCEEVGGKAQRIERRGGFQGNERSKLNLRRGPQGGRCRICAAKGKSQWAVRGTDLCRHHGGLLVATNKGTRRPPRNRETIDRRILRRAIRANPPPPWLLASALWRAVCVAPRSLPVRYRMALAAAAVERGDPGAAEAWLDAAAAARRHLEDTETPI